LEIHLPGWGKQYLWVEFIPVGDSVLFFQQGNSGQMLLKSKILTEQEKPGAATLFNKSGLGVLPNLGAIPNIIPTLHNGTAFLFGN